MKTINALEADRNFAQLLADVERGETVFITKDGRTVAEIRPMTHDRRADPEWMAAHERMLAVMRSWPKTGYRVGKITEDDKYGDAP